MQTMKNGQHMANSHQKWSNMKLKFRINFTTLKNVQNIFSQFLGQLLKPKQN